METNETAARERYRQAEQELLQTIEEIEVFEDGDLQKLESQVLQRVLALGRTLMECRLNKKTKAPPQIVGACGHEQKLVGYRAKLVFTLMGQIEFKRAYYQCQGEISSEEGKKCSQGSSPEDEKWGVSGKHSTPGVQKYVSYLCARMTMEEAAETFAQLLPLGMSARQALNLMRPIGEALAALEDKLVQDVADQNKQQEGKQGEPVGSLDRLYIELDGIMARIRRGTAPMEEHELAREGDIYREVKVGAVFEAERGPERSELAPGVFVDIPKKDGIHYVARRTAQGGFGPLLHAFAVKNGLYQAKEVIVLGDGAPWIWKQVEEYFPQATQIVDLYHAKEHVWEVAHFLHKHLKDFDLDAWVTKACDLLIRGQIEDLVQLIGEQPALPPDSQKKKNIQERAIGYFTTNAERMRYLSFRERGMHLGSGIAEAACKTVVATRAKRSGMRWTPEGLDALLPLRTSVLNGTYAQFWEKGPPSLSHAA